MIEKAHEHTRKDIQLNKDSIAEREARPQREKVRMVINVVTLKIAEYLWQ